MSETSGNSGSGTQKTSGLLWAILACIAAAAFFAWSMNSLPGNSARGGLAVGSPAPEITASGWVNGEPPEDLKGKVVVVDAWATWCLPCREKAPELVETYQHFSDREDVVFIGLTSEPESAKPQIEQFLKDVGITWPNGYGASQTLQEFQAQYIPSVWVVGKNGKVTWNYNSSGDLEAAIEKALAE